MGGGGMLALEMLSAAYFILFIFLKPRYRPL